MAGRRCPGRDDVDGKTRACPTILTRGERRCPRHAKEYEQRRGSSTERGYGSAHQRLRADWQRRIDDGEHVVCARCSQPISEPWALDHADDRTGYLGPSHKLCNDAAGGRASHQYA